METALNVLSEVEGASRREIIRRAVLDRYERTAHAARVGDATSAMVGRWQDVLDRLAQA
jgi:hypothetical protein